MNFEGLTNQLKFLHHSELCVHLNDDAGAINPKLRLVFNAGDAKEGSTDSVHRRVEHCVAIAKFGCVLNLPHLRFRVACFVFHSQNGDGLELAPADRESNRVPVLQNVRVPPMLLNLHSQKGQARLLMLQTAQDYRVLWLQTS